MICLLRKIVDAHIRSSGRYTVSVVVSRRARVSRVVGLLAMGLGNVKSI